MEKTFCLGLLIGALGGALLVANNYKARSLVKKSQTELMQKVNEMMDEKLNATGGTDESTSQSQNS
jgi:hypothetical protein